MQASNLILHCNSILANAALTQTNDPAASATPASTHNVADLLASRWLQIQTYYNLADDLINTAIYAAIALFVALLLETLVRGLCNLARSRKRFRASQIKKINTLQSILLSVVRYSVVCVAFFKILLLWGVSAQSLTVGSAILAGAIGFGSQGLVQDMITGFSLLFEDQLQVGDYVQIGDKAGYVREVGLRIVKLEGADGAEHILFNRTISTVTNLKPPGTEA